VTRFRLILVLLLLGGAYWAALPWLGCVQSLLPFSGGDWFGVCTFGIGTPGAGGAAGRYLNLLASGVYLGAALWVARTKQTRI
jgi:hypothetical protein